MPVVKKRKIKLKVLKRGKKNNKIHRADNIMSTKKIGAPRLWNAPMSERSIPPASARRTGMSGRLNRP